MTRRLAPQNPAAPRWDQMQDGNGIKVPIDLIAAGNCFTALFIPWDADKIFVEGCPDDRNVWSYVIDIKTREAIQLPSNEGLIALDNGSKTLHMSNYQYHPEVMTMNASYFNSLPEEYQKVLSDAAWLFVETENKISLENAEARLEEMKEAGCDIYIPTAEERQAFIDACQPVYDHFVNKLQYFTQDELDLVKSLAEGK